MQTFLKRLWAFAHRGLRYCEPFLKFLILLITFFNEAYSLAEKVSG